MGNQTSSCNPSSSCTSRLHSALQPCAVAKVLLLDGQVLHFTKSVKAIHLLLQHPHHCLCPAQSLRLLPSSHHPASLDLPSCLLPDDALQLGRIYILLPLHTFRLFVSAAISHYHLHCSPSSSLPPLLHYSQAPPFPAPFRLHSFPSGRSSPWIDAPADPTSILAEPTSNQEEPTASIDLAAQSTAVHEAQTSEKPASNHILSRRKPPPAYWVNGLDEEKPTSQNSQPNSIEEKPSPNRALPVQSHLVFSRRSNPIWINAEEPTSSIQEQPSTSCKQEWQQLSNHQAGGPASTYRTFISKPSINTALRKANLSSLPASSSTTARRSFELQRPRKGVIDIRRCRSWRPRLQAITEMSTW